MKLVRQWLIRRLIRHATPYLKSWGLLQTVKYNSALVWEPTGGRILVLAPHMDDEVIGCGGTLLRHVQCGAEVIVVFMTDGRHGSQLPVGLSLDEVKEQEAKLVETRKREAAGAMDTLGVKQEFFLDEEDGSLASKVTLQERLREILDSIRPDLVYLPFFLEGHPDHRATSQILVDATADLNGGFDCLGYEVWTPLFPNCLVNISDVVETKKRALQHYKSQLADVDYVHTSLGLNAYRSGALMNRRSRFVEAFFRASLPDYRDLHRRYCSLLSPPGQSVLGSPHCAEVPASR